MKLVLLAVILVAALMVGAPRTSAADQASFNGASSAVQNAFVAVQTAGNDGGNITALVTQLNGALALLQNANTENASNPSQASTDLQSAVSIAQGVQASSASVAQQGISARQFQLGLSIGSAIVIVGLAAALYLYGDRVYRRLWLWMFRGQIVKKIG